MNLEPYLPFLTALVTLINTYMLVHNSRRLGQMKERVNGMYLQSLAEAERRGRRQQARALGVAPDGIVAAPARRNRRRRAGRRTRSRLPGELGDVDRNAGPE